MKFTNVLKMIVLSMFMIHQYQLGCCLDKTNKCYDEKENCNAEDNLFNYDSDYRCSV